MQGPSLAHYDSLSAILSDYPEGSFPNALIHPVKNTSIHLIVCGISEHMNITGNSQIGITINNIKIIYHKIR